MKAFTDDVVDRSYIAHMPLYEEMGLAHQLHLLKHAHHFHSCTLHELASSAHLGAFEHNIIHEKASTICYNASATSRLIFNRERNFYTVPGLYFFSLFVLFSSSSNCVFVSLTPTPAAT